MARIKKTKLLEMGRSKELRQKSPLGIKRMVFAANLMIINNRLLINEYMSVGLRAAKFLFPCVNQMEPSYINNSICTFVWDTLLLVAKRIFRYKSGFYLEWNEIYTHLSRTYLYSANVFFFFFFFGGGGGGGWGGGGGVGGGVWVFFFPTLI